MRLRPAMVTVGATVFGLIRSPRTLDRCGSRSANAQIGGLTAATFIRCCSCRCSVRFPSWIEDREWETKGEHRGRPGSRQPLGMFQAFFLSPLQPGFLFLSRTGTSALSKIGMLL